MKPKSREWGDFQTPPDLANRICRYLAAQGVTPDVILEPTCGIGNFIVAALATFPQIKMVYGVEIQAGYVEQTERQVRVNGENGRFFALHQDNIFTHTFSPVLQEANHLLILGNLPWVTNAELGALNSHNLPRKSNLKTLSGLDALTGKSNFDISEYILIHLLDQFAHRPGTVAMLCKTTTARNIVQFLPQKQYPISKLQLLRIDAGAEFGASVEACLFVLTTGASKMETSCQVATLNNPHQLQQTFGWVGPHFVANVQTYEENKTLEGKSPLVWRQGIKHDCAPVMELEVIGDTWLNGKAEVVDVENSHVYWLLKGSDLKTFEAAQPRKKVIVTQRYPGENTLGLQTAVPQLWHYLTTHKSYFDKRKSTVYQQKPSFAMFGIGNYSFKPYKVAIAGFSKSPVFSLVCPIEDRPVMLDDTCYFLGFDSYTDALLTVSWLNSSPVQTFLRSLVFTDAKRPITKEILMRINGTQLIAQLTLETLHDVWDTVGYTPQQPITEIDLHGYQQNILQTNGWQNLSLIK